ncbi:MAG: hypothetical protein PHR94_07375 [Methylomonas lenta]|nr:hypothetical protein [Methylomonas lenta]
MNNNDEESMMDINANNSLNTQLASTQSKSAGVGGLAGQQPIPATDRDGDQDNSVAQDSVTLSSQSLKLASTSSVQGTTNQTQIPNRQEAQKLVDQLVTGLQNNPEQAQNAVSNASSASASKLLA